MLDRPHNNLPNIGTLWYNSSYPFPSQPITFPPLATTPSPPAIHKPARSVAAMLTPYHLLFPLRPLSTASLPVPSGVHPIHFAHPQAKCQLPTPTRVAYPANATAGCLANPCATYSSPMPELPPSTHKGITRFTNACPTTSGTSAYPNALVPVSLGQGILRRWSLLSAPYHFAVCRRRYMRKARPEVIWSARGRTMRAGSSRGDW